MRAPLLACSMLKCTLCSLIAAYMRTGTLTRPNEIAPVQSARGMQGDGRGRPGSNVGCPALRERGVQLAGEHRDRRCQVEPAEQHDDEGEHAVGAGGVAQLMGDVVAADRQ